MHLYVFFRKFVAVNMLSNQRTNLNEIIMKHIWRHSLTILMVLFACTIEAWADDFTVERAVNLGTLDSWADISQFQWQEIDHVIQDNREEMEALKTLFYDPTPKDTVGFYNQIYKARDNQYIVLRLDKAQGNRPFHIRVKVIKSTIDPSKNSSQVFAAENYVYIMPPNCAHHPSGVCRQHCRRLLRCPTIQK